MWSRKSIISGSKSNNSIISIQLLEPIIFVGSNLETSPVVRGTVNIKLDKSTSITVQDLSIHFHGMMKTQWRKDSKVKNNEKSLATNDIQIVPFHSSLLINGGGSSTIFTFEMPLPGGLPETVKCPQINVEYLLSTKMNYRKTSNTAILLNETIQKPVIIARLPENGILAGENFFSSNTIIDSLHKRFNNWCQYRITIDKKSAALGSRLPVTVEIAPTANGLRLKQVFLQLLERRRTDEQTNQLCHFLYPAKGSSMVIPQRPLTQNWQGYCEYQIPGEEENKVAHSTHAYPDFHVSHILLVSLVVSLPDATKSSRYSTKTISFQTQIDLLDSRLSQLDDQCLKLPPYDYPISTEEIDKLNRHGLFNNIYPPSYEESSITV